MLRDVSFYVAASMVPSLDALPEMKAYTAEDAKLTWRWKWKDEKEKTGAYQVYAFGGKLDCCGWAEDDKPEISADGDGKGTPEKAPSAAAPAADDGKVGVKGLDVGKVDVGKVDLGPGIGKVNVGKVDVGKVDVAVGKDGQLDIGKPGVGKVGVGVGKDGAAEIGKVELGGGGGGKDGSKAGPPPDAAVPASPARAGGPPKLSLLGKLAATLGRAPKPRLPPSAADPSALAGQPIVSEDDILHLRHLPEFGGALRPADVEVLLQSLLMPFLRVPLLLRFFAEPSRTAALAQRELQKTLDAAIFEPGAWQAADAPKALPSHCPAPDRSHLATAAGTLFQVRGPPAAALLWEPTHRPPTSPLGQAPSSTSARLRVPSSTRLTALEPPATPCLRSSPTRPPS